MINTIVKTLLIILFLLLPLINSHLFNLVGIDWGFYVNGNYEFTKVMFFNILVGITFLLWLGNILIIKKTKEIIVPKVIPYIVGVLILSSFFSLQPFTSLFGDNSKAHSLIMFLNLIGLFILIINIKKSFLKKLINIAIFGSFFVLLIGLSEYLNPTFNYGELSNRAFSTLGHPNYLILYILLIIPLILDKIFIAEYAIIEYILGILLLGLIILLVLTKSLWGIILYIFFILYIVFKQFDSYLLFENNKYKYSFYILSFISLITFIVIFSTVNIEYLITKLNSFISRFYIWETTINIIFSDIKNIIIGSGLSTLDLVFDSYKLKELYIFENIGFTADRPHNIFLNYFYHFGILGVLFIIYILYKLVKIEEKTNFYYEIMFLFLLFTIFNYPSIVHYIIIILIGGIIFKLNNKSNEIKYNNINKPIIVFISFISIIGIYSSFNYYIEENSYYINDEYKSKNLIYNKILKEDYENNIIQNGFPDIKNMCDNLTTKFSSAENNFYCGDILWNLNEKEEAKKYYNIGLEKIPDMWNENSQFHKNKITSTLFVEKRFYAEKFSDIEEILKRVGKNIGKNE